ncbi:MAG: hypothetical protein HON23_01800 [Rickettsiales bacterium]|jgi:hypothetical protein|nr:hypothetical protein [Rickettsiales bacterium]
MQKALLSLIFISSLILNQSFAQDYINFDNFKNSEVVSWSSKDGQRRFLKSNYKNDFISLAPNYQPQINPLYCGIASSVILLNTLHPERPNQASLATDFPSEIGNKRIEYHLYSQLTLLNKDTEIVKEKAVIDFKKANDQGDYDPGLTLLNMKELLGHYDLSANIHYVNKKMSKVEIENFRDILKSTLNDNERFVIANFLGKSYGATTGGHISPVAAYDKKTDSVLLLDVATHKNPWYWVDIELFYQSMHTKDGDKYRGYLVVSK